MNSLSRTRREEYIMCRRVGLLNTRKFVADGDVDATIASLLERRAAKNTSANILNRSLIDLRRHAQCSAEARLKVSANYPLLQRILSLFTTTALSDLVLTSADLLVALCAQSSSKIKLKLAKQFGPYMVCYLSCGHQGIQTRVVCCLDSLSHACPAACLRILKQGAGDELAQLLSLHDCTLQLAVVNALLSICNCGQTQRDAVVASGLLLKNLEPLLLGLMRGQHSTDADMAMELLANSTLLLWFVLDVRCSAKLEKLIFTLCDFALTQQSESPYFYHRFLVALGRCLYFLDNLKTAVFQWPPFFYLLLHCALCNRCARLELLLVLNKILNQLLLTDTFAILTDSATIVHLALIYQSIPQEKAPCGVAGLHLIERVFCCINVHCNALSASVSNFLRPSVVISVTTALLASRDAARLQPALHILQLYLQLCNDLRIIQGCRLDVLLLSQLRDVAVMQSTYAGEPACRNVTSMCVQLLTLLTMQSTM